MLCYVIVDLCLFVCLGRSVSSLPRQSEASRRPETLDSPAVDERHKMILNKFKITEITVFKNKFNGTCDFTIKKQVQLPDPHATEVSSIVVRKVEVLVYNDCSSATAYLGSHRK